MDDHSEALALWQQIRPDRQTLIHVDAHLDLQNQGWDPSVAAAIGRGEALAPCRGNANLPWGGLHCGNFLYPALRGGWIGRLIWVFPPHLMGPHSALDWVRSELCQWCDLTFEEFSALRAVGPMQVEGTLLGCHFLACCPSSEGGLPPEVLQSPVLLDIDVDYFVSLADQVWSTPQELKQQLGPLQLEALTVATSVSGGYLPPEFADMGLSCIDVFGGRTQPLVPSTTHPATDRAARSLMKQQFQLGLDQLQEAPTEDPVRAYLAGSLHLKLNRSQQAFEEWQRLPQLCELSSWELAELQSMLAGLELSRQRARPAVRFLEQALEICPQRAHFHQQMGQALRALGQFKAAARSLRRALSFNAGHLSWLETMLELARCYSDMGQVTLAQATHLELQREDVTGRYKIESMLEGKL